MDKIKNFVYKNNINLYIFLKKYVQKKLNFPVDIDIFLLKNLEKNSVIVEAGAANGNDTVFFGENFPKSKIYSLEPMSSLYEVTSKKVKQFENKIVRLPENERHYPKQENLEQHRQRFGFTN